MTRTSPHLALYDKDSYAPNLPDWLIEQILTPIDAFTKLYGEICYLIIEHTKNYAKMKGYTNYLLFLENVTTKMCLKNASATLILFIINSFTPEF